MRFHLLSISVLVFLSNTKPTQSATDVLGSLLGTLKEFLEPPSDLVKDTTEFDEFYDFIIVGAGSAGCVLANRLSEVPEWKILLLEAGKDETQLTDIPLAATHWRHSDFDWGYKTEPQNMSCLSRFNRQCIWPRGKAVGGTSVINLMMYTRGHPKDYDEWETLGNPGWGWKGVFPYFKKLERVEIPELMDSPYRGKDGHLNINYTPWRTPLAESFVDAGRELGFDVPDYNGEKMIGFAHIQTTTKDGRRVSSAKAHIRPIRHRKNLFVAKEALVTKIIIDPLTKTALGVEFIKGLKTHKVKANKEVILSAGALNSPQLLMLSGIGPAEHLSELGIPVVNDLRVGENLQDHIKVDPVGFNINDTVSIVEPRIALNPKYAIEYAVHNTGPLTCPGGVEALALANSQALNSDNLNDPSYDAPDLEFVMMVVSDSQIGEDRFTIHPIVLKPKSKGRMLLKSKNPLDPPLFYPNYLSEQEDVDRMITGLKFITKIGKTKSFAKFDAQLKSDLYPDCSHLPFGTDSYWECGIRHYTISIFHQSGTCKMGPKTDPTAVVDPELKVYGIKGLRVVDCSIIPIIPASHTNSVAMMIGEKGADLIKQAWA